LAGEMLIFPGYVVKWHGISVPLLHAGLVSIDDKTGVANYSQQGLYGGKYGDVQIYNNVGTVQFDKQGEPTHESLTALNQTLANAYGQSITPISIYKSTADASAINQYAQDQKISVESGKTPYTFNPLSSDPFNVCFTYAANGLETVPSAVTQPSLTTSPGGILNQPSSGNQPSFGPGSSFNDGLGSSAAGGFLLYPNKPNTNQMQSVYRK
jgi:hypothetical protein